MKLIIPLLLLLSLSQFTHAQPAYPTNQIAPELLEGANVVVRKDYQQFTVQSSEVAVHRVEKVISILNEEGASLAPIYIFHDPQRKLRQLKCSIYDAEGRLLKEVTPAEFRDYPAVVDAPLYEHLLFRVFSFPAQAYPFTVAYSYEVLIEGLYQYPTWSPMRAEGMALEKARFQLDIPRKLDFRYKAYMLGDEPKRSQKGNMSTYTWEVNHAAAVKMEALGPEYFEITPNLQLYPGKFAYEGVKGSAEDWSGFGAWVYRLLQGQDAIPDTTLARVHSLVADVQDTRERAIRIYEDLRKRIKPLALPLGVGSYQPLSATTVEKHAYGDSKALSNYLLALLRSVGIEAHYALINAGRFATRLEKELPGAQFNRAVVAVPLGADTLWLDCTQSRANPAGYLGYELSDRWALLVTEEWGELRKTPAYAVEDNLQARSGTVSIDREGNASAVIQTRFAGMQYAHVSPLMQLPPHQQEQVIRQKTNLPDFRLRSFRYHEKQQKAEIEESLRLEVEGYAGHRSRSLSFVPNLLNQMDGLPPLLEERRYPLIIRRSFFDTDRLVYQLPEHKSLRLPEEVWIQSDFGEYRMQVRMEGNTLVYERSLKTYAGSFPASAYGRLMDFYEAIVQADQRKVILIGIDEQETKTDVLESSSLK